MDAKSLLSSSRPPLGISLLEAVNFGVRAINSSIISAISLLETLGVTAGVLGSAADSSVARTFAAESVIARVAAKRTWDRQVLVLMVV
jgi:hypothetical protein